MCASRKEEYKKRRMMQKSHLLRTGDINYVKELGFLYDRVQGLTAPEAKFLQ